MSIDVTQTGSQPPYELAVVVREGRGESRHTVTLDHATFTRLAGTSGATPVQLVEAVFRFLLDREPKESILARFDVTVVGRYFPEFADEIGGYLG